MKYFSTRNKKSGAVDFGTAALTGLAPDGGLYVPETFPQYPPEVRSSLGSMSFQDLAFETVKPFTAPEIPDATLGDLLHEAFTFEAPLISVGDRLVLELFQGPTAAFKDFGARFMARTFAYLRRGENKPLHILTATSGDTGGAVADGFYGVTGLNVTVLYPKGRVTPLQERQIAGLGGNISAVAVEGSFDDCQRLVKEAFKDGKLKKRKVLSSANSINICRLIPQAVYYAAAAGKAFAGKTDAPTAVSPWKSGAAGGVKPLGGKQPIVFCVPSGNFGNLTAGLYALEMGAPIRGFIAATNVNRSVPKYLETGYYEARFSEATISNAMDVGAPSNFERLITQWPNLNEFRRMVRGVWVTDDETREAIREVYRDTGYFLDPHTAVAWRGVNRLAKEGNLPMGPLAVLATAHPAKFAETVQPLTGPIPVPPVLGKVMERIPKSVSIPAELSAFLEVLA
ncbi:MAG: threonine synthase [Spirochaetaceae bacterium]|jgi:threonine synthase|nr:threonine synthase [Spirochaetaceae bacterium]